MGFLGGTSRHRLEVRFGTQCSMRPARGASITSAPPRHHTREQRVALRRCLERICLRMFSVAADFARESDS